MTTTITTVGIYLTEDERGHLTRLCTELEVLEESALRNQEGVEAKTRAAEQAALRKLMGLPAANAAADGDRVRTAVREACQRFGYTLRVPDIDAIVERVAANLEKP